MAKSRLGRAIERMYGAAAVTVDALVRQIQTLNLSDRAAAALLGVHHRTWQRWRKGQATPKAENLVRIETAVRAVRAKDSPLTPAMAFTTRDRDDPRRERTITGRQLGLTPAKIDRIERTYIEQGPDAAAAALVREIEDDFYHDYFDGNQYEEELDIEIPEYGGIVG